MKKFRTACLVLGLVLGIFVFLFGGYDDSPGAQLIGIVLFAMSIIGLLKIRKS